MSNTSDAHKYDDIIDLPRPVSARRAPMSMKDRAAQFSPFAALTGYDAAIRETGRLTESAVELDESEKSVLNEKLQIIAENLAAQPEVSVVYFQPDEKKTGGAYVSATGRVKKIDMVERALVLTDRTIIFIDRIVRIESCFFSTEA